MPKHYTKYKTLSQYANAIARANGHNRATEVIKGPKDEITQTTPFGYRKFTTGEYVPNAYRRNFGWKNTYYQSAEAIVSIRPAVMAYFAVFEQPTERPKK